MTGWLFGWLATLSSGFTPLHTGERKKEGKKVIMAVEEGAVFLTQVSSANIWIYSHIYNYIFFKF